MTSYMGSLDRGLQAFVVAPVAVAVALIVGAGTLGGLTLFVVAGSMLATAATRYCPNYTLIGISIDPRLHRVGHRLRGVTPSRPAVPARRTDARGHCEA